jgi:hypothetical protein
MAALFKAIVPAYKPDATIGPALKVGKTGYQARIDPNGYNPWSTTRMQQHLNKWKHHHVGLCSLKIWKKWPPS